MGIIKKKLSSQEITATITGGYIYINIPDSTQPSGYKTKQAKLEDFINAESSVLFYANLAALPTVGAANIIYVTLNDYAIFVYNSGAYHEIAGGGGGSGDMLKSVYDPDGIEADVFDYDNFTNKPTIPDAQIQSDWNQATNTEKDYIKNKPSIPSIAGLATTEQALYEVIELACSDLTTANTAAANVAYFHMPFTGTLVSVISSLDTVCTGSTHITDINKNATTVLSTKLSIDASADNSLTATSQAVISVTAFTQGDKVSIDRDQVGATIAGKGHVISMIFTRT